MLSDHITGADDGGGGSDSDDRSAGHCTFEWVPTDEELLYHDQPWSRRSQLIGLFSCDPGHHGRPHSGQAVDHFTGRRRPTTFNRYETFDRNPLGPRTGQVEYVVHNETACLRRKWWKQEQQQQHNNDNYDNHASQPGRHDGSDTTTGGTNTQMYTCRLHEKLYEILSLESSSTYPYRRETVRVFVDRLFVEVCTFG
jgi:hypothetical protein